MSILVKNLTKTYDGQKAIDNISFELSKGNITGFIGPNGSGKSTTMKAICGILTPDSGNIFINGNNISELQHTSRKLIGYLPENNPLYNEQYIKEYLNFVGKIYKLKKLSKRVDEVIEITGLGPEKGKKIGQLSKGYKQRVGLAQALIHDPRILILDEPTTGLDPNQIIEIRELIKSLSGDKTVLLSTHILQEVEAICEHVIMLNKGIIVADENTSSIKQDKEKKQTVLVEFKEEVTEEILQSIPEISGHIRYNEKTWLLESNSKSDIRENIFKFAMANQLNILELRTQQRTLEDTFQELSKKDK